MLFQSFSCKVFYFKIKVITGKYFYCHLSLLIFEKAISATFSGFVIYFKVEPSKKTALFALMKAL